MHPPEATRPHAVFRWGDGRFAVDVGGVQEVVTGLTLTALPRAGDGWLGVTNLRGEILPAVSLAKWFPGEPGSRPSVFMVLRTPTGRLALAADGVVGVLAVPPAPAGPPVEAEGEPEIILHRWQPPGDEPPVRCLDAGRLAQKLRDHFVLSNLTPV